MTDASCALRRTLLVPIDGRSPRTASAVAELALATRIARAGSTMASRGSSRGSTAATSRPSGSTAGMSFALWTARSISPLEQRVLDFLDEQPLAAGFGQRRALQPIAGRLDDDDLDARARAPASRAATVCACQARAGCRACRSAALGPSPPADLRGAVRLGRGSSLLLRREAEQPVQRVGVRDDGRLVADRLELLGRRQQQLLDDQLRDLVDARARLGRQAGELRLEPLQLRLGGSPRTAGAARRRSG